MLIKATKFEDFEIPTLRERFGVMTLFPLPDFTNSKYHTQGPTVNCDGCELDVDHGCD